VIAETLEVVEWDAAGLASAELLAGDSDALLTHAGYAWIRAGDALVAPGDREGVLQAYRKAFSIFGKLERSGDVRAGDKIAATFALQLGFGRDRAVAKPYFFVPCVAGPFVDILEQVPVKSLQMLSVELQRWPMPRFDLNAPSGDIGRFALFQLVMRGRAELVF